jgi:hypothetical protein
MPYNVTAARVAPEPPVAGKPQNLPPSWPGPPLFLFMPRLYKKGEAMPKGFYQKRKSVLTEELTRRIAHLRAVKEALLRIHPGEDAHEAIIALDERICWLELELERAHWQWVSNE